MKTKFILATLAATTVTLTSGLFSDLWHLNSIHPMDIIKYPDWTGFNIRRDWVPRSCNNGRSTPVRAGDFVHQHYVGRLANGTRFDSSYERNGTFNFFLDTGKVINGIDVGMKGMCKWERRDITIPPQLGYGGRQVGKIPPNSTLYFEVSLDDAWISPFKIETIYKPRDCDRNMRKTSVGDKISIHYNGTIDRNLSAIFYETYKDRPLDFVLGEGNVIRALDMGLFDMCVGEKRVITAPPLLAYGEWGRAPLIPGQATLRFEIVLNSITDGKMYWVKTDGQPCQEDEQAQDNDIVSLLYSGESAQGKMRRFNYWNDLYTFKVGSPYVLRSINFGVRGMCVGEKRRIFMSPEFVTSRFHTANFPRGKRLTLDIELKKIDHR